MFRPELGINLEPGLYVSRIISGSLAAKEGNLAIGDRILNVRRNPRFYAIHSDLTNFN